MNHQHSCEEHKKVSRREAVRQGLYGAGGILMANRLARAASADEATPAAEQPQAKAKAKAVIQIFLWGGMSHNDTWDPKPGTGREYLGDFTEVIPTNVDGIQLGALFPRLAQQAEKYSLIRGMTHGNNGHETAAYMMQTGHPSGGRLAFPSVGAVFSMIKGESYQGLIPPYVVLTRAQGRFSEEGFLGPMFKPFATGGNPNAARFEVEGIMNPGVSDQRQKARRDLLDRMNTLSNTMVGCPQLAAAEQAKQTAYELILGEGRETFDLGNEPGELRDLYGRHVFGQSCLAARRLVEVGVPYVVINYPGGWDTHGNHFATMRRQCPDLDQGLAMLIQDLHDRKMLDSTLVWCTGEFGRTPKVDWAPPWNGGRHHFGAAFTALVGGGGFKGGHVVGKTDETGSKVVERPVWPLDLLGSIYQLAGIDVTADLPHPEGLPARVLPEPNERWRSEGLLTEIM